jgi:hypothetical protein
MREALAKWTSPVLAFLPDLRGVPVRRQVTVAIIASAILHGLFLVVAVLFLAMSPERVEFARAKPKLAPLEIQLVPSPPAPVEPHIFTLSELQQKEYLDSTGLKKAELAPDQPLFESDQNMIAASELPATGDAPLPSIDGRTGLPFTNFTTQQSAVGPKPQPEAADIALAAAPTPTPPPPPQPPPIPAEPAPQPAEESKPPPLKKSIELRGDEIALLPDRPTKPEPLTRPTPTPEAPPIMPPTKPQPSQELAKLVTPAPKSAPPKNPGFQPEQQKTKIEGSISNRGKASVDAVRTPLAVYKKQISEAVGSRWYYYIKQRADVITLGVASFIFTINREGRVTSVTMVGNTSNQSFANLCEQSIREAEFAPPPPEAIEVMKNGTMEVPFSFTFYDTH